MPMAGRTIAVTGANGLVGLRLVEALRRREDVDRVLALDIEVPTSVPPGVESRVVDVRDPGLAEVLAGCDALVHLASTVGPARDEVAMREVNVGGARNVLTCAAEAGVRRLVHLSSATAYGAHPDNDVPLREDAPLRANPDLAWARHKAEVEQWLWEWAAGRDDVSVAALRPSLVTGPGTHNVLTRLFETRPFVTVRGQRPPVQFTHVEDVVQAIELLLDDPSLTGPFNCASEGWLSYDEFLAISGVRNVELPLEIAHQVAHRTWAIGLSPVPPGCLHYGMHPWVVDVNRLVEAGWRPKHSNRDALAELAAEHRDHVAVGPVRVRRSSLRNGAAAAAAVAGLGAIALRRRRRASDEATGA